MEEKIKELNLLLMLLTGWEEDSRKNPGEKVFRAWKGYLFTTLNTLADEKLIIQSKDTKSVILTDAGKLLAEKIKTQYLH
jgi:predicted transcriptional regulator